MRYLVTGINSDGSHFEVGRSEELGGATKLILHCLKDLKLMVFQTDTGRPQVIAEVSSEEKANLATIMPKTPGGYEVSR